MLKPLDPQEFDRWADFAYELALDTTKSGYPTYTDGIKTWDDFMAHARRALTDETEAILLYERDGAVAGWIHYYWIPEDRYLDTSSFCIAEGMGDAVKEFTAFARERFPGYTLYLGFPRENRDAVTALEALGFTLIEESYNDVLDFDGYEPRPEDPAIVPVTRETYPLFAALHAQHDWDMYWNTERILNALDSWKIFVLLRRGAAAGAIYSRQFQDKQLSEIFGVDFPGGVYDGAAFRALMTAALNHEKRRGTGHMVCFTEEDSHPDALACGYRCVGQYVCYQLAL